jgi:hypothetical protein
MPVKKTVKKAPVKTKSPKKTAAGRRPDKGIPGTVAIRMYCIGTGDCFILKFYRKDGSPFTMMIDCGSCMGDAGWFTPYITDLATYVDNTIDLLIVTHEHNDHVNGFQKCGDIFASMTIKTAWFAWTENPKDPGGDAAELLKKRKAMKAALGSALQEIKKQEPAIQKTIGDSPFSRELGAARQALVHGLESLADINLDAVTETSGKPLAGMKRIKEILADKDKKIKTKIQYLNPGSTITIDELPGIRFHVLGPPKNRDFIFKEGKQGTDVFRKNMVLNESALAARAFKRFADPSGKIDSPFLEEYLAHETLPQDAMLKTMYDAAGEEWRKIDSEWLLSAGTLALRLTSHINNTSLALAIEAEASGKVVLMPGDAEYGGWESWHLIKSWNKKGKDGEKHLVEDLLNRTIFYKVGHHLSYNGTALEKGINMMPESGLVAMATLDRERISKGWKSTMPNKHLLNELIRRTGGRFFIMNETEVEGAPSLTLDPETLDEAVYKARKRDDGLATLYKQYSFQFQQVRCLPLKNK